jgi:predicted alpha/beta-fold hydrolase
MSATFEFPGFRPHPAMAQRHVQTVFGTLFPRQFDQAQGWRQAATPREFTMADGDRLTAVLHRHPDDPQGLRPLLVTISGLEGHIDSHYMRGMSTKAYASGYHSLRLNYRTCGNTEHLARRMYNSTMIEDVDTVIRQLASEAPWPIVVAGVSLGANKVLRLLGTYGDAPPPGLLGGVAISPPIDLAITAEILGKGLNRVYDTYFLRSLKRRLRRKLALGMNDASELACMRKGLTARSLAEFDSWVTAPLGGYADAMAYYRHGSTGDLVGAIRVPALLIHAQDDPMIPMDAFAQRSAMMAGNPALTTIFTTHGGHVGFLQAAGRPRPEAWMDDYWAENAAIAYMTWLTAKAAP